jgi:hypothetical protein
MAWKVAERCGHPFGGAIATFNKTMTTDLP